MEIGVTFPQIEIGANPEIVREYTHTAEDLGFGHLLAYDHVLGANHEDWNGAYDIDDPFHEPLTLFSHLAAETDDLTFVSGILILPQRQTALVAKQAAEVDILSDGRLRLGVGLGWNQVEYEALGQEFSTRSRRIEAQIPLLQELWTERSVTVEDEWHTINDAGLNPRPVQQPIPVWMGGTADPVLRRAARLADGWLPQGAPGGTLDDRLDRLWDYLDEEDRDHEKFDIVGRMNLESPNADDWPARVRAWREIGASHLAIDTMGIGIGAPAEHVRTIKRFADTMADAGIDLGE